ncbi:MAG: type II toxin-antitoxin system RelE/ParE family toxin [Gammaproteobacteria bacterium]|nr:type II toxin-antitoxin system RelE/ParE family toxin [Gammaproteobacteria bacterium]MDE0367338.1 type II toxin-antitoxin system RelE/ParE family toxin [Gammaproteobacteria bacterium]
MSKFRLSRRAATDLENIAGYTIKRFGVEQARVYRDSLKSCFQRLANNPEMGRKAEQLARGLRRFEHQAHIVFYTVDDNEIYVVRVLHSRMDVRRHF